ncbi:DUF4926 domain-containing protein [Methylobacterium sp. J-077]|uniref:DUF4926 domain-containing protein n=1 Tax=Methylobacterium sp. J-077 TaxID=2836656 RepID=UPI001FBB4483|nr:DUF4926 domain-containing protein [Methylobacterium sp. J-077]MCJ2125551.1 DUF4926 domain-containing protein [Methylobacterium sp. J-077]
MSLEIAYRFRQDVPPSSIQDLDDVVLLVPVVGDNGVQIAAGTLGTILSVHGSGTSYAVEFDEPDGAVVTVLSDQIALAGSNAQ